MKKISLFILTIISFTLDAQNSDSIKEKKQIKSQKRYIHPQSKYISVSAGWQFNATHTRDPNGFFDALTMVNNGIFPNITYEHGIRNNFFAEIGYDHTRKVIGLSRDMGDEQKWSMSGGFFANYKPFRGHLSHNLNLGSGYRVIGKNNFHFFNIHGGIFLGVSNKSQSDMSPFIGNKATYTKSEEHTGLNYQIERTVTDYAMVSFGTYLGVSKEIRLSDEVRFFVKYIHRFGLNPTFRGTYSVISDDLDLNQDMSFRTFGGGALITGGLKILLFKNKLNASENL
jgi:hypothetical protein